MLKIILKLLDKKNCAEIIPRFDVCNLAYSGILWCNMAEPVIAKSLAVLTMAFLASTWS